MVSTGYRIQRCRTGKGWPQSVLAERAGIAQANLSNIEKGKRDLTVSMLLRIAAALDVKPSELLDEEPEGKPRVPLTRDWIEKLAEVIVKPETRASVETREAAGLFRRLLPEAALRESGRSIENAWAELRSRFSEAEIKSVFQRIEDARQRVNAKKTD